MASPGCICHILAFRHSFLREPNKMVVPDRPPPFAEQYTYLFNPEKLETTGPKDWAYRPFRMGEMPFGFYGYSGSAEAAVRAHLTNLAFQIQNRWLPWADKLSPSTALEQISPYAKDWWVARLWIEDYENYLAAERA